MEMRQPLLRFSLLRLEAALMLPATSSLAVGPEIMGQCHTLTAIQWIGDEALIPTILAR